MKDWTVYILACKDGSLYTGITTDVDRRIRQHRDGVASKYTAARGVERLVYTEQVKGKGAALKREHAIKQLSREAKLNLVASNN